MDPSSLVWYLSSTSRRSRSLRSRLLVSLFLAGCGLSVHSQSTDDEAIRHFKAAQNAQTMGFLNVAVDEYSEVIRLHPEVAEAYASLGLVYSAQKKYQDSVRTLRKAEKLKPRLPGVSLYLGTDYMSLNQTGLAIPYLLEAVKIEPANREALTWLCRALWKADRVPAALQKLNETSVLFPSDASLLLDLGEAYRKAGDQTVRNVLEAAKGKPLLHQIYGDIYRDERAWEKAMAHYERALAEDPHWPGAHFGLGEIALHTEKFDEAAQEYHLEIGIAPNPAAALARLAEVQLLTGNVNESLTLFRSAIRSSPEAATNALGLPRTYPVTEEEPGTQLQQRLKKSVAVLERKPVSTERSLALAVVYTRLSGGKDATPLPIWRAFQAATRRSSPVTLYEKGLVSYNSHNFSAAQSNLSKWLKLHPQDMQADYLLARCYRNLSYSTLEKLLAVSPDSYSAHQLLGGTYEDAGKNDQALAEYKIVATTVPNLPGVHYSVGHLLRKMGEDKDAFTELSSELAINPDHAGANAEMGAILLAESRQSEAALYLEKAIMLDPDLSETRLQLGKAYYLQKNFTKAVEVLQIATRNDPQGQAHYQLGLVYRDVGQKQAAQEQFSISRKAKLDSLSQAETQMTTVEKLSQ
jgi:tetratricopeptide (TPR) repeat protein